MTGHAVLPPSAAERWIACPGSRQAEREAPAVTASEFSALGTAAHAWFARGLRHNLEAGALTADPLLQRPLAMALDAARRILGSRAFMVEQRLPPLARLAELWGTSDVVGFSLAGPVDTIIDLKFGEAVAVEADSVQLGIYGLLAARCFGVAPLGLTAWVIQPRHDHADGLARSHHYSLADLDRLEALLREKARVALGTDAARQAGEWCRFCAAAASCPVLQAAPNAMARAASGWFRPAPRWLYPAYQESAAAFLQQRSPG
jgi:hypothetical protein